MTQEEFEQWLEDRTDDAIADIGDDPRGPGEWLADLFKRLRSMAVDEAAMDEAEVPELDEIEETETEEA